MSQLEYLAYTMPEEINYYLLNKESSQRLIEELLNTICNFDPLFKSSYMDLFQKANFAFKDNELDIQKFISLLKFVQDGIINIKQKSLITRKNLTNIRDSLLLSIHSNEDSIEQLDIQKKALHKRRETLEEELRQNQEKIAPYKKLSFILIIDFIFKTISILEPLLHNTKNQINDTAEQIIQLTKEKDHHQQELDESINTLNTNQRLTNTCDNLNNIQTSLKRMNNLALLKNKLITLEKDWLTLISIANNYKKQLKSI